MVGSLYQLLGITAVISIHRSHRLSPGPHRDYSPSKKFLCGGYWGCRCWKTSSRPIRGLDTQKVGSTVYSQTGLNGTGRSDRQSFTAAWGGGFQGSMKVNTVCHTWMVWVSMFCTLCGTLASVFQHGFNANRRTRTDMWDCHCRGEQPAPRHVYSFYTRLRPSEDFPSWHGCYTLGIPSPRTFQTYW